MSTNRCALHNLWLAHSPTPSLNCAYVYVVCSCGQPRQVPMAAWEAEEQRRALGPLGAAAGRALEVRRE